MNESDIISALQKGVVAAVAESTSPTLPVKYLEVAFSEPNDGKWLEIVWIPNNRIGDFWGVEKNHQGLFRLILHWPNEQAGVYAPLAILGSVADYFYKGRLLASIVQIYEAADFTGSIANGDETLYPVSLRYQSYRGN